MYFIYIIFTVHVSVCVCWNGTVCAPNRIHISFEFLPPVYEQLLVQIIGYNKPFSAIELSVQIPPSNKCRAHTGRHRQIRKYPVQDLKKQKKKPGGVCVCIYPCV